MRKRSYFGAAPVDEIELANKAKQVLAEITAKDFSGEILDKITDKYGIEIATMALYQWLVSHSKHSEFISGINGFPPLKTNPNCNIKILVVPGLLYEEHPELGGTGELVCSVGKACGFEVEVIETNSRGSVSENAAIIKEKIDEENYPNIWLTALSKGTAEARLCLQSYEEMPENLHGFINVSGVFKGTPLADIKLSSLIRRVYYKILCGIFRISYAGLNELRSNHHYWQASFNIPDSFHMIHVVGIPIMPHVNNHIVKKYKQLAVNGPNEGMIYLKEILDYPGKIYPVWGADHLMRAQGLSALWYQLFNFINSSYERRV